MLNEERERKWAWAKIDLDIQEIDGHWLCKELIWYHLCDTFTVWNRIK